MVNEYRCAACMWKGTEDKLANKQCPLIGYSDYYRKVCPKCGSGFIKEIYRKTKQGSLAHRS